MSESHFTPEFPEFPELTEELIRECRERCSYLPVAFDCFRKTATIAVYIANIESRSPAFAELPTHHLNVFRGLLSRICRLMRAVGRLGHKAQDKEAILILSRSVVEAAIRLMWIVREDHDSRVKRFVEAGLQAELTLKEMIDKNVQKRGHEIPLETRMLKSINKTAQAGGMNIQDVRKKIQLPDLKSMMRNTELEHMYHALQTMPSSSVHGNWADLFLHYLDEQDGELMPRHTESEAEDIVYLVQSIIVLLALRAYVKHVITDDDLREGLMTYLGESHDTVLWIAQDSGSDEFVTRQQNKKKVT